MGRKLLKTPVNRRSQGKHHVLVFLVSGMNDANAASKTGLDGLLLMALRLFRFLI